MRHRKIQAFAGAMAALLAISWTTTAPSAEELKTVHFGTPNLNLPYLPIYVADVMGLFKKNGIKPAYETFKTGGSTAMAALIGGDIDIFPGSSSSALRAYEHGSDVVVAGALVTQYTSVVVARKAYLDKKGITSASSFDDRLKVLKGANIGVTSPGSGTDQLAHFLLKKAGLDPTRDVNMVYVGGAQAVVATFAMNRVDVIITSSPSTDDMILNHNGVLLFNTAAGEIKELDGYPYITINTTRRWIDGDRVRAVATIKALAEAETLIHDASRENEVRQAVYKKFFPKLNADLFNAAWKSVRDAYPKTPRIGEAQINMAIDFANAYSTKKFKPDARKAFTNELIKEAQQ